MRLERARPQDRVKGIGLRRRCERDIHPSRFSSRGPLRLAERVLPGVQQHFVDPDAAEREMPHAMWSLPVRYGDVVRAVTQSQSLRLD
jgi:hypothetical protein